MPVKEIHDHGRVLLSETEHHGHRIDDPGDLRARIVQHALFAGHLVVTDSQVLNNAALRPLLGERHESDDPSYLADLAALVGADLLFVARRDSAGSLREVRDGHASRDVQGVPSEEYADTIDEISEGHHVLYSGSKVSDRFKERTVEHLKALIEPPEDDFARTLRAAVGWIDEQDPFYYNSLRQWSAHYASHNEAASDLALESVEKTTNWAYRTAVPSALDVPIAWGAVHTPTTVAVRGDVHRDDELMPSWELNPRILRRLPAEIVCESTQLASRGVVVEQFARVHAHQQVDAKSLEDNAREYLHHLQAAALAAFRGSYDEALDAVRDERGARLHVSMSTEVGAVASSFITLGSAGLDVKALMLNLLAVPASVLVDSREAGRQRSKDRMREWLEKECDLSDEAKLLRVVSREEPFD
ncbi:hypothetical protein [Kitasatospora sp. NPDC097643]|uniref:hypothetical protein n=1 Tax=Kitasatospora sp. NPDC097643 TaxID=3157230 RepID=UPI0033205793